MKRSPSNILGIVLGIIVIGGVIYSAVAIYRRAFPFSEWFETGSPAGWMKESGEEKVEGNIDKLEIEAIAGSIDITSWDQGYISVNYTKSAPSQADLDNLKIEIDTKGSIVTIKPTRKSKIKRGSVSFEVSVPSRITAIRAKSVSGDINLRQVSSKVDQTLQTVSGRIETDDAADLDINSISGSVKFGFSGANLSANTVSGRIEGEIRPAADTGKIKIGSVSGSVKIDALGTLDARLSLHSVSGSVNCDLPITNVSAERNRIEGTLGKGSIPVDIGTTSGSIRLAER